MAEFATLADLKQHANITRADHDDELGLMLDAAEDIVRGLVGSFAASSVTESLPVIGGTVLLSGRPAGPVTVDGGDVTNFVTSAAAGVLYGVSAVGPVTVTYTVGGGPVPAAVKLAVLVVADHLWQTQRGTSPSPFTSPDEDPSAPFGAGFAIPNRAKELLQPYVRPTSQVA